MAKSVTALPILEILANTSSSLYPSTSIQNEEQTTDSYNLHTHNFISVLNKVGGYPFALYCMSGTARIGKSYALNLFIKRLKVEGYETEEWFEASLNEMFSWRNGTRRETVGINLWPEPFFVTRGGRRIAILLMDAQGLFDNETTFQQNAVIFALCSLFSSVCIFNVVKKIDADTLQHLHFFSDYSKAIGNKVGDEDGIDEEGDEFQKLVILVRDYDDVDEFGFGYHDNCNAPMNSSGIRRNYFHQIMSTENDPSIPFENKATINGIRNNYKSIGIILHPDPGSKFRRYPNDNNPDEEYMRKSKELVELMISEEHLVTKKIGKHELTGKEFIPYVQHLDFICQHAKDHFPSARTIGESTVMMTNSLAVSNAYQMFVKSYEDFMESHVDAEDDILDLAYEEILEQALHVFKKVKKLGGKVVEDMCSKELVSKCKTGYESMKLTHCLRRSLKQAQVNYDVEIQHERSRINQLEQQLEDALNNAADSQTSNTMIVELENENQALVRRENDFERRIQELESQIQQSKQVQRKNNDFAITAQQICQVLLNIGMTYLTTGKFF